MQNVSQEAILRIRGDGDLEKIESNNCTKTIELFLTTHSNGELRKGKQRLHSYQAHTKRQAKTPVPTVNIDEVSDTEESSKIFKVNLEKFPVIKISGLIRNLMMMMMMNVYSKPQCSCQTLFVNECIFFSVSIF